MAADVIYIELQVHQYRYTYLYQYHANVLLLVFDQISLIPTTDVKYDVVTFSRHLRQC